MSYFVFLGCRKRMGKDVVADRLIGKLNYEYGYDARKESCISYGRKFVNDLLPQFDIQDAKDKPFAHYNDKTYRETVIGVVDSILKCDQLAFSRHLASKNDDAIYIVPDCRRTIEGDYFRENLKENCMFIQVVRPDIEVDENAYGEGDMDNFGWDHIIDNNGTLDDLNTKSDKLVELIHSNIEKVKRLGEKQYV